MLPTATSCTSATKIFTWASPRCRRAPYVERQTWQVVIRTVQAHRRHSTSVAAGARAGENRGGSRHYEGTKGAGARMVAALGRGTVWTRCRRARSGTTGAWRRQTAQAHPTQASAGPSPAHAHAQPHANTPREGARPARPARPPPPPHRDSTAPPAPASARTCTRFPAAVRRQQRARRQDKARGLTQVPRVESRRPRAHPTTTSPPRPPPHRHLFPLTVLSLSSTCSCVCLLL